MRTDMPRAGLTLVTAFALTIALVVASALLPAGAVFADEPAAPAQPAQTENAAGKMAPGPETEQQEEKDLVHTRSRRRGVEGAGRSADPFRCAWGTT